jgi:hypothetical protein
MEDDYVENVKKEKVQFFEENMDLVPLASPFCSSLFFSFSLERGVAEGNSKRAL